MAQGYGEKDDGARHLGDGFLTDMQAAEQTSTARLQQILDDKSLPWLLSGTQRRSRWKSRFVSKRSSGCSHALS